MDFGLSVQELLNTQYLKNISRVIAGHDGLAQQVRWVHVLEIRDVVAKCVNGNELVLTTGIGFTSKDVALKFVQELIDQKVSALCIETALYYHEVDPEVIELADRNGFPIIVISEISRFVDICRGLNTLLLQNESGLYSKADQYESQLFHMNSKGNLADGIRYTANYLDIDVAFLPEKGLHQPGVPGRLGSAEIAVEDLINKIPADEIFVRGNFALKRIEVLGKTWGHLVFSSRKRNLSDFEILVLSRLSSKITSDIYKDLLEKEKTLYANNDWIKKWLDGNLPDTEIKKKLGEAGIYPRHFEFIVCCTRYVDKTEVLDAQKTEAERHRYYEDFLLYSTITVKNIFEREGLFSLGYMESGCIYFIILGPVEKERIHEKAAKGIRQLRETENPFMNYENVSFAVGKSVHTPLGVTRSCETAVRLLDLFRDSPGSTIVFDEQPMNQVMIAVEDRSLIQEYIEDYLGELLEPRNIELLSTLRVYFDCNCSKQKTAEKLFIVRQTLYFRLQKIAEILGEDFDTGERRFALEFAIHAHSYLTRMAGTEHQVNE